MKINEEILTALYKAIKALNNEGNFEEALIIEELRDMLAEKFDEEL